MLEPTEQYVPPDVRLCVCMCVCVCVCVGGGGYSWIDALMLSFGVIPPLPFSLTVMWRAQDLRCNSTSLTHWDSGIYQHWMARRLVRFFVSILP